MSFYGLCCLNFLKCWKKFPVSAVNDVKVEEEASEFSLYIFFLLFISIFILNRTSKKEWMTERRRRWCFKKYWNTHFSIFLCFCNSINLISSLLLAFIRVKQWRNFFRIFITLLYVVLVGNKKCQKHLKALENEIIYSPLHSAHYNGRFFLFFTLF